MREFRREIASWTTRTHNPKHGLDKTSIVLAVTPRSLPLRAIFLYKTPYSKRARSVRKTILLISSKFGSYNTRRDIWRLS